VADHAGQRQSVHRTRRAVVVPSPEFRIPGDGDDLLQVVHLLQAVGADAGADGDHVRHAVRPMHGEVEGHHAAEGGADHGMKFFDTEILEQWKLRADDVMHGDPRKITGIDLAGGRIDRAGASRTVAAAEVVGTNDEILVGIQGAAGADKAVPPTGVQFLGPPSVQPRHVLVAPRGVLAAAQGMEEDHGIGAVSVEFSVGLVSNGHTGQSSTSRGDERIVRAPESVKPGFYFADAFAHRRVVTSPRPKLGRYLRAGQPGPRDRRKDG